MRQPFAISSDALQLLRLAVRLNCHTSVLNSKLDAIRSLFVLHGEAAAVPEPLELLPLERLKRTPDTEAWQLALQAQEARLAEVQTNLLALLSRGC